VGVEGTAFEGFFVADSGSAAGVEFVDAGGANVSTGDLEFQMVIK